LNDFLEVRDITKSYIGEAGSKLLVLDKVSFSTREEDYITSILAPASSGKTTLLKIISGLDYQHEGGILLKGNKVANKIPFIPERPSSFPWLDVEGNINLVFKMMEESGNVARYKMRELIDMTGLTGYENHFPSNKSQGFRFRISLARTIAVSSAIILLDDSFKAMDNETKDELFQLLKNISVERKIRFLIASSNIPDAFTVSDRIFLMRKNPVSIVSDINIDKNNKGPEQIKNQITAFIKEENIINMANFSI